MRERISGSVSADWEWWGVGGSWEWMGGRGSFGVIISSSISLVQLTPPCFWPLSGYSLIRSSSFSQAGLSVIGSWRKRQEVAAASAITGTVLNRTAPWIIASICLKHVWAFLSGWLRVLLLSRIIFFCLHPLKLNEPGYMHTSMLLHKNLFTEMISGLGLHANNALIYMFISR